MHIYIYGIAKTEGCQIFKIGGIEDHIHIFVKLKPSIALSDFARKVKSNSIV